MHNFFRPGRNGNSAGSEVTHRPMAAEINRCRLIHCGWSAATAWWGQGHLLGVREACASDEWLEICMLMYPDHLHNWLNFGHALFNYFPHFEPVQIWGFPVFSFFSGVLFILHGAPEMFRVALMGTNYSMPCFHFTQCTPHWLLFLFMHVLLYFIVWMIQLFALASGVYAHLCHIGILIHQLDFLWLSCLFSCAISVYLTLFGNHWGTEKQCFSYPSFPYVNSGCDE